MEKVTDERLLELRGFFQRREDEVVASALGELIELRALVIQLNARLDVPAPKEAEQTKVGFSTEGAGHHHRGSGRMVLLVRRGKQTRSS